VARLRRLERLTRFSPPSISRPDHAAVQVGRAARAARDMAEEPQPNECRADREPADFLAHAIVPPSRKKIGIRCRRANNVQSSRAMNGLAACSRLRPPSGAGDSRVGPIQSSRPGFPRACLRPARWRLARRRFFFAARVGRVLSRLRGGFDAFSMSSASLIRACSRLRYWLLLLRDSIVMTADESARRPARSSNRALTGSERNDDACTSKRSCTPLSVRLTC